MICLVRDQRRTPAVVWPTWLSCASSSTRPRRSTGAFRSHPLKLDPHGAAPRFTRSFVQSTLGAITAIGLIKNRNTKEPTSISRIHADSFPDVRRHRSGQYFRNAITRLTYSPFGTPRQQPDFSRRICTVEIVERVSDKMWRGRVWRQTKGDEGLEIWGKCQTRAHGRPWPRLAGRP
jgi:hypothetical protein